MEDFNIDIAHILQNRDFSIIQKLKSYYSNIQTKIAAKVEDATTYKIEFIEKRTQNDNKISELQQEVESLKSEIDATDLQQKIVDKKIANIIEEQKNLEEEVNKTKSRRNSLSIEIVELNEESKKRKEEKLLKWKSIKCACQTYKQYLDFRIRLINNKEQEQIKVSFFINDTNIKDEYFVLLLNHNDQWKVEEIHPTLKTEHLTDFKEIIDFSKQVEISNIIAFLCKLRHIFLQYYLNIK
ncbi:hypothetical protein HZU73_07691 [Apis mellifera caucasica]|uniref:Uncharacterized protein LOC100576836 isoform X1 n=1 Tax=Apis mellifera TaxID=7460 RepID=A0A7M7L5C9_APIME|nr:uncharacterized protein LOC100576836 isoform X1 [Apis mellifera]KAG6797030.1 hypothetical protein HZU73_07691 [Apis mellifera caucasica]KAG9436735.1 hypothetical protein HZU67_01692 [Apis mellifera carnica]|eukprot:XP_026296905.1 uncharacterized protein LOC100576836 isoform X1 [Apis mellifera]